MELTHKCALMPDSYLRLLIQMYVHPIIATLRGPDNFDSWPNGFLIHAVLLHLHENAMYIVLFLLYYFNSYSYEYACFKKYRMLNSGSFKYNYSYKMFFLILIIPKSIFSNWWKFVGYIFGMFLNWISLTSLHHKWLFAVRQCHQHK